MEELAPSAGVTKKSLEPMILKALPKMPYDWSRPL
jgi:hypothetical protein